MIDYVVPIVATIAGIVLLGESLTFTMASAMLVILVGVRIVQHKTAQRPLVTALDNTASNDSHTPLSTSSSQINTR